MGVDGPMFRGLPQFEQGRKEGNAERAYRTVLRETKDRAAAQRAKDEILNHEGDLPYPDDRPAVPRMNLPKFTPMEPERPAPAAPVPEGYLREWEDKREDTGF